MRKTNEKKSRDMVTVHNIKTACYNEFAAAGVAEFANWCLRVEQAVELKSLGVTVDQWIEWRKAEWDLSKLPVKTPALVAKYIARGMSPAEAKKEMTTAHPRPMRTR